MEKLAKIPSSVTLTVNNNVLEIALTGDFNATDAYEFWNDQVRPKIMQKSLELGDKYTNIDTISIDLSNMGNFQKRGLFPMISSIIAHKHKCIIKHPSERTLSDLVIAKFDTLGEDRFQVITRPSTDLDLVQILEQ